MIKSPLNHLVGRALVLHEYRKESLRARKAACFAFALPKRSGGFDGPNTSIHSYFQFVNHNAVQGVLQKSAEINTSLKIIYGVPDGGVVRIQK